MEELEKRDVWPEIVRLRDELPLAELARRYHTTPGAISAALERTGALRADLFSAADEGDDLPPEPGEEPEAEAEPEADPPDDEPVTMLPQVAKALENLRPGSKDALIAAHAALLGQVPDAEVARRAKVSIRTIASFRSRHGIPGYAGPRRKPDAHARRSRIDPYVHLLGKVPDYVVAKKAGVTVHAVRSYRAKHDIPMQPDASVAAAVLPSVETSGTQAWRVAWLSGSGRRFAVLLARDFEDALQRALHAGFGAIVGLELLGNVVAF